MRYVHLIENGQANTEVLAFDTIPKSLNQI